MPLPGVLVDPERSSEPNTRYRAALCYAGPNSALSHLSALRLWGLPADDNDEIHVMTDPDRRIRVAGIRAHRRGSFVAAQPEVLVRHGLAVVRLDRTLVDAWPCLCDDAQRAPLLLAVNARMTTPERIRVALADAPNLAGRRALAALLTRLADGCRSELELWGYDRVLPGAGCRRCNVSCGSGSAPGWSTWMRTIGETATNFELDGAKWHASQAQRERDLRRDAALATIGIQVVRFTHDRLRAEPDQVRREALAILASRRVAALAAHSLPLVR